MASQASQAHPIWPEPKDQLTNKILLHFVSFQNLPETAELKKTVKKCILCHFWSHFRSPRWPVRPPRLTQRGPNQKSNSSNKYYFILRHCSTYQRLLNRIKCKKAHFWSVLAPLWGPWVASLASQAKPVWPEPKGQLTIEILLHFQSLQNLPETTKWKKCHKDHFWSFRPHN